MYVENIENMFPCPMYMVIGLEETIVATPFKGAFSVTQLEEVQKLSKCS